MKKLFPFFFIALLLINENAKAQSWKTPIPLEPYAGSGGQTTGSKNSLTTVNGNPAMAYWDAAHGALMYVRATDASGTNWGTPMVVDSVLGVDVSILIVNGNPAIAYFDANSKDLKYIRATDANGTAWSAPLSLDVTGDVGRYISMQIVGGNPAIAYMHVTNFNLKYIRATDASGATWAAPISIDTDGGYDASMQIINGNPAISYCSRVNFDLKYVRASDVSGATWGSPQTLDATGNVGTYSSLLVVGTNPAIAYSDLTNDRIKYIRASDASGTTWASSITLSMTLAQDPSLQIVNGLPAIAWSDVGNSNLCYTRATNALGTTWGTSVTIQTSTTQGVGSKPSMAIINGNPAISYYDGRNTNIAYIRATDISGASWPSTEVSFDVNGICGRYNSLRLVNGNPALSYYDGSNKILKYVRSTNASGTSWGTPMTIDAAGDVGQYSSMQIISANPAVSYYDNTNHSLKYVRATNADGTTWATAITVDASANPVGEWNSLQQVNGNPAIAYYDEANGNLKYVRATDASGSAWGTPIAIDVTGDVGRSPVLIVVNGNPAIVYIGPTGSVLKYVRATDASGTTWGTPVVINSTVSGGDNAMLIVNGNPAVAYYDGSGSDLKYVRAIDASGTAWSAPVTLDAAGNVGSFATFDIINGNPAISYVDNTNQTVKYIRATDVSGSAWATAVVVPTTNFPSTNLQFTSLVSMGTGAGLVYFDVTKGVPFFVPGPDCTNSTLPTLTTTASTNCGTKNTTLSIVTGTLNSATGWAWYSGSCGGTSVGNGLSVDVSPSTTTTYYARGEGGCVTPGACASIVINVNDLPAVSLDPFSSACSNAEGFSLTGGAPAGGTYTGAGVSGNVFYPVTAGSGTHTITYSYTDANSCTNTATADLAVSSSIDVGVSLSSAVITANASGAAYQWIDCNNGNAVIAGETNQSYTATVNGKYAVIITQSACADTSVCTDISSIVTSSLDAQKGFALEVFPNPSNGDFTIRLNVADEIKLNLLNNLGQVVRMITLNPGDDTTTVNGLETGIYFIIDPVNTRLNYKIVVSR